MSELDRQKVARLAGVRRAAIRARSYCLVGFLACVVTAADLVWLAVWRIIGLHQILRPGLYGVGAVGLVWFSLGMLRKSREFAREIAVPPAEQPLGKPDFSNLGDGSQIVRDLEKWDSCSFD